jgi:hypothetical protein
MKISKCDKLYCHRCGKALNSLYYKVDTDSSVPYQFARYHLCCDCYGDLVFFMRNDGLFEFELDRN